MNNNTPTPTPRTDDFCNGLRSNCLETTRGAVDLANFARQLERELKACQAAESLSYDRLVSERDQLRKVCDAYYMALTDWQLIKAEDAYNSLPHVIAKNTK